jgi:hypothetical protein
LYWYRERENHCQGFEQTSGSKWNGIKNLALKGKVFRHSAWQKK